MREKVRIKVGMADWKVAKSPEILTTLGLGSCVGVALYDPSTQIGGLAHIMLPDSHLIKNNKNRGKFADTGIELLIEEMLLQGAKREKLIAKIAGGAHMFEFKNMEDTMRIGTRNVSAVLTYLKKVKIPVLAQEVGSNYGRTIELDTQTGILLVKTIGYGIIEI